MNDPNTESMFDSLMFELALVSQEKNSVIFPMNQIKPLPYSAELALIVGQIILQSLTFTDLSSTPHHSGATVLRIIGPKVTTGATTRNTQFTIVPL